MEETPGVSLVRKVDIRQVDKSAGFRSRAGFFNSFTAGPNVKSFLDVSFPYAVDLLAGDYYLPATSSPKSRLWVEIAPNTDMAALVAGAAISAAVASTDTEVTVNAQAKGAIDAFLTSNGDKQTEEVFFRLTSIPSDVCDFAALKKASWDSTTSKLKSPDGAALGLTAASGDKVYLTMRWEDGTYISPGQHIRVGDETFGSSSVPKNVKLRVIMLNENATAMDLGFNLTYYHS
jgi:hypothetical protein